MQEFRRKALTQEKHSCWVQEQPPSLAFVDSCRATIQDGPSFALAVVSVCGFLTHVTKDHRVFNGTLDRAHRRGGGGRQQMWRIQIGFATFYNFLGSTMNSKPRKGSAVYQPQTVD
jgi:hypothetical protein